MVVIRELINAALSIVKARPPTLKDVSKVNTQEFIDQKKEMFLVQMGHEIIKNEIALFKKNAGDTNDALKQSENKLKSDELELNKNKEVNSKESNDIAAEVDNLEKIKKAHDNNLKLESQKKDFYESEIKKNTEVEQRLQVLEDFIDKITPNSFITERQHRQLEKTHNRSHSARLEEKEKPMYFTDPQQLFDIFTNLEKENLTLISEIQVLEQTLEDEKHIRANIQAMAEEKIKKLKGNLYLHKNDSEAHEPVVKIKDSLPINRDTAQTKEWLDLLKGKIIEIYKKVDPKYDYKTKSTLSMLSVSEL